MNVYIKTQCNQRLGFRTLAIWIHSSLLMLLLALPATTEAGAEKGDMQEWINGINDAWDAYDQAQEVKKIMDDPSKAIQDYFKDNYKDWILGQEISADMHTMFNTFFNAVDGMKATRRNRCGQAAYNHAWHNAWELSVEGPVDGFFRTIVSIEETLLGGPKKVIGWAKDYLDGSNTRDKIIDQIREGLRGQRPETYSDSWTNPGCDVSVVATLDKANGRYEVVLAANCHCQAMPLPENRGSHVVAYWVIVARGTLQIDPDAPWGICFSQPRIAFTPDCNCADGTYVSPPRDQNRVDSRPGQGRDSQAPRLDPEPRQLRGS